MSVLSRVVLDDRAAIFVQAHLSGVNGFCSGLLETVAIEPGEYFTFAPRGTPRERLYLFDIGGLVEANLDSSGDIELEGGGYLRPAASLVLEQANLLHRSVEQAPGSVCIIDDFNPNWGDPGSDDAEHAFGMDDEVYHLLTEDDDIFAVAEVLGSSQVVWHGVAAICSAAPGLDDTRTTNLDSLTEAAHTVSLITCVAYDGEGFVAWRRRRR